MPDHDIEMITSEQLHAALRKSQKHFIILDCRSSHEYTESHIRTAVNFSIPSIMLRRFAAGKIDITSTIKCRDLKERILSCYKESTFVLYNNSNEPVDGGTVAAAPAVPATPAATRGGEETLLLGCGPSGGGGGGIANDTTINVLHRKLKQDGCRVVCLEGGYANFRQSFPEWCEDEVINANLQTGCAATEQLMGLRSLRISIPFSDSACSSSTESSDCESTTNYLSEATVNVEPIEILPGLFLGNASHSEDLKSLKKYNIKYILNVTPDLPNVFERDGQIRYLQIPITDHWSQASDLANHFPDAIKFIDEARSKGCGVLVHCLAGVSRSVTVTLAYLMFARTLSLNDAFLLVRSRKPDVSPNFHFMQQLHSFEQQLNIDPSQSASAKQQLYSASASSSCSSGGGGGGGASSSTPSSFDGGSGGDGSGGGGGGNDGGTISTTPFSASSIGSSGSSGSTGGLDPSTRHQQHSQHSLPPRQHHHHHHHHAHHHHHQQQQLHSRHMVKYNCTCVEVECKCTQAAIDLLGPFTTGISPDSGIEFDRWTPSSNTPK
ncbi:dual specificity protein phosphatase Mpk3-like isoform X1 [Anopheles albimanus]|uniref:dual specificity protein phosphatase Mpk3-like isoform X1 n=1 Tax=Anopheles albimanus TaxID=7167 RepID=UPI0016405CDD|nr:dual specificity protein phosphatase Mpk3-like isoform X1 [Anopheles albimanus]XP_035790527.1 dual specificity protein phosphatase Mpk3-like isoform X1 [Anopheles albimanus]XP_035790528.1 dual specificity protein phosphatase Mpk3-like isoform X1 [Anopheles albimanus]XP_035790529.1 dual specificity protein phosphatase Mpk3-like isoform X1 [Anopheles albimanus]XP_035790530.1 dual specificity protein phosphatase Mpk3-like isoform X1 [Anopheles albimanus]